MKVIDFELKGNVARFYLGNDNCDDYKGDDWNDRPYEHNAGTVYPEYVEQYCDIAFPFDCVVIEPREGQLNSSWCKDDMKARKVPCVIVVEKELAQESGWFHADDFLYWVGSDNPQIHKIYFGDNNKKLEELAKILGGKLKYEK